MPNAPAISPADARRLLAASVALLAAIAVAWANSLPGGPVFDDHFLVVQQRCFKSWQGIQQILTFDQSVACAYRPMRYLSYGFDHWLFGDVFWGYHLGNVVRHTGATAAVAGLAALLASRARDASRVETSDAWVGLAVAALWALHPAQTDSVTYVSGRRDILAGLWTFAAVGSALFAAKGGGMRWLVPLWATLFAFLSKESAVVIPVLFLMWRGPTATPGSPIARTSDWVRQNPATVVAVAVGLALSFMLVLYRGVYFSHSHRGFDWWGGTITSNFATVAALQLRYLGVVALVSPLIGDYRPDTIPLATSFADPRAIAGAAAALAVAAVALRTLRTRPLIGYGLAWYLVCLAPVSHIFPHHELFAEHYLYLPLFGLALAAVGAAQAAIALAPDRARWQRIAAASLVALCATMVVKVVVRNRDFADERTFYERVVAHAPTNLRAVANLGNIAFEQRDFDTALLHLGALADQWTPGTADERHGLARAVEAARRVGDLQTARTLATRLATNHPDAGAGHRHLAGLAFDAGDHAGAFAHGMDWWRTAREPAALSLAGRSLLEGARRRTVTTADVASFFAVADASTSIAPPRDALYHAAMALHALGDRRAALAALRERRPAEPDPAWNRATAAIEAEVAAEVAQMDGSSGGSDAR